MTPGGRLARTLIAIAMGIPMVTVWLMAQTPTPPTATAPPSVESLIADGIKRAKTENKTVFVEFGASWCAPCRQLDEFLRSPDVQPLVDRHFVLVKVTIWETGQQAATNTPGGEALIKKWGGKAIPFYTVLDAAGAPASSDHVGYPVTNDEIAVFLNVLSKGAPRLTAAERTVLDGRLTAGSPSKGWAVVGARRVWTEGNFFYRPAISADGKIVVYGDGGLYVHDLAKNATRMIALPASAKDGQDGDVYDQPAISKDGRFIAVSVVEWKTSHRDLRIVPIDATAIPDKPVFDDPSIEWIRPHEWMSDGRRIIVELKRKDATAEIAMLSLADSTLKTLKRRTPDEMALDANYTGSSDTNVMLSPDEQYIAFDVFRPSDQEDRDIFFMRLSDGRETPAVVHHADDAVCGWTRDGANVLFVSERTGEYALWAAPFKDGRLGDPVLVQNHLGEITPLGLAPNGSLVYAPSSTHFRDVWTMGIDFANGVVTSAPREYIDDIVGNNTAPAWSKDGSELRFRAVRAGKARILARSVTTGAIRELPGDHPVPARIWAPDEQSYALVEGTTLYLIDAKSGQSKELARNVRALRSYTAGGKLLFERSAPAIGLDPQVAIVEVDTVTGTVRDVFSARQGGANRLVVSPDGRTLFHRRPVPANAPPHDLVARDLATGAERVILAKRALGALFISPDGRLILTNSTNTATNAPELLLVPTSGEPPRVLRVDTGPLVSFVAFAPDSRSMLASRNVKGTMEYWWVPFDDRQAKRLEISLDARSFLTPQVSPDGKTIAFVKLASLPPPGVWALDFERRIGDVR